MCIYSKYLAVCLLSLESTEGVLVTYTIYCLYDICRPIIHWQNLSSDTWLPVTDSYHLNFLNCRQYIWSRYAALKKVPMRLQKGPAQTSGGHFFFLLAKLPRSLLVDVLSCCQIESLKLKWYKAPCFHEMFHLLRTSLNSCQKWNRRNDLLISNSK